MTPRALRFIYFVHQSCLWCRKRAQSLAANGVSSSQAGKRSVTDALQPIRSPHVDERDYKDGSIHPPKAQAVPGSEHLPSPSDVGGKVFVYL